MMNALRLVRGRLFGLLHKGEVEAAIAEELRFHLEMRTQDNIAQGMSIADARREATRRIGNIPAIKDACRDVSGGGELEVLWQDVRFAARMLVRDRGFTAIAVVALALGIGANTALFTVMSNVLLRPLPFVESHKIISIWGRESDRRGDDRMQLSYPDFQDLQARNSSFTGIGGYAAGRFIIQPPAGEVSEVQGARVTSGVFEVLGTKPFLGRTFTAGEDEAGSRAVMISHQLWQQRFAANPDLTCATMLIDAQEYSVIGVMPPDFRFPVQNAASQIWVTFARDREPLGASPPATTRRDAHFVYAIGRLKPNVAIRAAEADLNAIARDVATKHPETSARFRACACAPLLADLTKSVRPALLMLLGAALCVFCVACVNVANLLLARSNMRLKEIAIRAALGAGRRRILRQLLTESLLLAVLGGSVGLLLAVWGTHWIVAWLPPNFPRLTEITPDARVLSFTCLITLATSCFFGFAPAWRCAHCDIAALLNSESYGANSSRRGRRLRHLLVVTEMALSFVLLVGAGCLLRALWKLESGSAGFNAQHLIAANISLADPGGLEAPDRSARFYQELLPRIAKLKEVDSVSAVYPLPFTAQTMVADFEIIGQRIPKPDWPRARAHAITLNYFQTMEIPLLKGRDFDERDRREGKQVVIINDTLARTYFPNEDPLGKWIRPGLTDSGVTPEREIIGVVGDVKGAGLATEQRAEVYIPHPQCASSNMTLVVRSDVALEPLIQALRRVVQEMDGQAPLCAISPMEDYLAADIAQPRLNSGLLATFAAVAVLLSAIGVYGVTSYSVMQRRHEIGIRLALGAQKLAVFRLVVSEGVRLILWSVIAGSVVAFCATPLLRGFGYGSGGNESSTIVAVMLLLITVGCVACGLPAHRAAGDDPLAAIGQR